MMMMFIEVMTGAMNTGADPKKEVISIAHIVAFGATDDGIDTRIELSTGLVIRANHPIEEVMHLLEEAQACQNN